MFAGLFDEFFGVPTHPFAVHAPIVLLPIAAIVAVVFALRSDWRERASWGMTAGVFALTAMLFVAKESGEAAQNAQNVFGNVDRHSELGDQTFVITLVWLVVTAGLFVRDRQMRSAPATSLSAGAVTPSKDPVALGLSILAAVIAMVAMVWLIRTGHAGAESRWKLG
jgi:uncharacterized membrane protein